MTQVREQLAPTALTSTPTEDEATRAAQSTQEKLKAEKARKKREQAKTHEEAGQRQQDQMYYGYAALDALQRRDRRPPRSRQWFVEPSGVVSRCPHWTLLRESGAQGITSDSSDSSS